MNATSNASNTNLTPHVNGGFAAGVAATEGGGVSFHLLENVHNVNGKTVARCPACAEDGHDKTGDHLVIDEAGRFGCVKYPGAAGADHRRRVFALVGEKSTRQQAPLKTPQRAAKSVETWADIDTAAKAIKPRGFDLTDVYPYSKGGRVVGWVARYEDGNGKKTFRQFHPEGDRVAKGEPVEKWPLLGAGNLGTGTTFVCEGEKTTFAAIRIYLNATCSAGGSGGAVKTDWTPLAGGDVCILADNDAAGEKFAADVCAILLGLGCTVRILRLPGLPAAGDLVEYLEANPETAAEDIERMAAAVAPEVAAVEVVQNFTQTTATESQASATVEAIRSELWTLAQAKLSATELYRKSATAVCAWLHERGRFYHHSERRDFAGVMFFDSERKTLLPVQSDEFRAGLADALAMNRSERVWQFVQSAVETEGLSERSTGIEPAAFWAARDGACYLSNGPGSMARIGGGAVALVDNGTDGVLFPASATLPAWRLCDPVNPFECCRIFADMQTMADHGKTVAMLWAVSLPTNPACKPPVCFTSLPGGGKTATVRGVFRLYGIPDQINAATKSGEGDFWAGVDGGGLVCFDNVDSRIDWLPDALAAAATGGTHSKRKLYTDSDKVVLRSKSWVALTSANPMFASDAGLSDRLLVVRLERRKGETAEGALFDEVDAARDSGLSWICNTLAGALADRGPVPSGLNQRHPDFAAMAVRIGRACGQEAQAITALRAAEADKGLFNLENDSIGALILELVAGGPFNGTTADLLEALKELDTSIDGRMSAKRLGKRIAKLWPHLENTLQATKEIGGHTKVLQYQFNQPAGFAGFKSVFSEKSPTKEKYRTLPENVLSNPANPANDLFDDYDTEAE
jgi:hypothetical protein